MIKLEAIVQSLYVGDDLNSLVKRSVPLLQIDLAGIVGDRHAGYSRKADSRNKEYPRGAEIRNWRQWSAVSIEELIQISKKMDLPQIEPSWLGSNLCFAGVPNLSLLPKGSLLTFPEEVVLAVEEENLPCTKPGRVLAAQFQDRDISPSSFIKASMHLRGLVGVVNRPGTIRVNDQVRIQVYQPKIYSIES